MRFLDDLVIQWTGSNEWILVNELRCVPNEGPQITVPAGLRTDLASIPRILWSFLPPTGLWARASVLHDWTYRTRRFRREKCDRLFLEAMQDDGVGSVRHVIYRAVRAFGERAYRNENLHVSVC